MRFLIDECLPIDLVSVAGQAGHEAPANHGAWINRRSLRNPSGNLLDTHRTGANKDPIAS
jgi:hypothetical protein